MAGVNQEQLAKALKLSRPTVSRSLANHPSISADTRERVQAMAVKLGYRGSPSRTVRRSRQAKPLHIGVLVGAPLASSDRSTFPHILQGIQHRATIEHADVDVLPLEPGLLESEAGQRRVFGHIRQADWRGAILIYPFPPQTVEMLSRKLCLVSALMEYSDLAIDLVDTDHGGVRSLVARLAQAGHRRIGFATWRYRAGGVWASRRFAAYAEEILERGLELRQDWVLNLIASGRPFPSSADLAAEVARLRREEGVTAWVCAADHQAYQLISDLRGFGLEVPRDCSVVGFDGNDTPPGLPPLATLRVPNQDVGASAVASLISRLLHPGSAQRKVLVETSFVPGATIGPPPAA